MEEVKKIYIDDKMGVVFETADKKRYAYKYFSSLEYPRCICDIELQEIKKIA